MREKVKTILLYLLVLSSVFLTQKLWIQLPARVLAVFEPKTALSSSYLLSDMISPNRYLLKFNNEKYTILYEDKYKIWEESILHFRHLLGSDKIKFEEISKEKYLEFQGQRSIICFFPEQINTYLLAKAWEVNNPNKLTDTIPNISDIFIFLGSGNPFFVFSQGDKHILAYEDSMNTDILKDKLEEIEELENYDYYFSIKEILPIEKDIFTPYEVRNPLPIVYVTNEIATLNDDEKDRLAERFFSTKIDYIREIVESNGSSIYISNNDYLKLNINGALEYFHPLEEDVKERNLFISLSTAADFLSKKAGTYKGMFLARIENIESDGNLGFKFVFRYRVRGIPLVLGNKEVGEYIQMEVFNNHIRSYKHFARSEMGINFTPNIDGRPMLTSGDIIDNNYNFLEERYLISKNMTKDQAGGNIIQEVLSAIDDITLAYYDSSIKDKDERLIGVWVIRIAEKIYVFDAYTGTLVHQSW